MYVIKFVITKTRFNFAASKNDWRLMPRKSRFKLLHQYYRYTGFYSFIKVSLKRATLPIIVIVGVLLLINFFVINLNDVLVNFTETFSTLSVLIVFFVSESILGLIPPEIFIAWSKKTPSPILYLSLLGLLSYLGGVVSYFIGIMIAKIPSIHETMEHKLKKQIKNAKKWGGFLIIVGALLPIPFSLVSITSGIIKYPFKSYLLFGLLRFLRFYLYALAIFNIVK